MFNNSQGNTIVFDTLKEVAEQLKKKIEEEEKEKVKIILLGPSGAGKSTLVNGLLGRTVAKTSRKTNTTLQINKYSTDASDGIEFYDTPGFDTKDFPADEYIKNFDPSQYDVFLLVITTAFPAAATQFFRKIKEADRIFICVRTHAGSLDDDENERKCEEEDIRTDFRKQLDDQSVQVIFTEKKTKQGMELLWQEIRDHLDVAKRDRFVRTAKAYTLKHLEEKKSACKKRIIYYAGFAAANGLNPVPGLDVSIDLATMVKMMSDIKQQYGLDDEKLKKYETILPLAKQIILWSTKAGVPILLKRYASRYVAKQVTKYIPILGQAVASSIGFSMTYAAGLHFLAKCNELAVLILENEMKNSK